MSHQPWRETHRLRYHILIFPIICGIPDFRNSCASLIVTEIWLKLHRRLWSIVCFDSWHLLEHNIRHTLSSHCQSLFALVAIVRILINLVSCLGHPHILSNMYLLELHVVTEEGHGFKKCKNLLFFQSSFENARILLFCTVLLDYLKQLIDHVCLCWHQLHSSPDTPRIELWLVFSDVFVNPHFNFSSRSITNQFAVEPNGSNPLVDDSEANQGLLKCVDCFRV